MALKGLLTLDLNGVTREQRDIFYDYLKKVKWTKIANIDTAWKCTFNESSNRLRAINICKSDVKEGARLAKISSIKSVVQVAEDNVEEFVL